MKKLEFPIFILLFIFCTIALCGQDLVESGGSTSFYFVQITDTHFGAPNCTEYTAKLVEQINILPLKIEFAVHTGDITSNAIADSNIVNETLEVMGKLNVPVLYVPGNHDIRSWNLEETGRIYQEEFGPLITRYEHEGVVFIGIYSNPIARSFEYEGFDPITELKKILEQTGNKPAVVYHHIPSVEDFYKNKMHDGWEDVNRSEWIKVLNSYNVIAVLAGHFHRDEHHWLGDVPLFISPSVADFWGRQPSYRIYEYKNNKLSYRTQYLELE